MMSASFTTSQDQVFYHGTRSGFTRGGWLVPRRLHHGAATTAPLAPGRDKPASTDQFVYLTTSVELAWVYAWHAPGRGRPKVLTVVPTTPVHPDPEHSPRMGAYRTTGWAKVVHVDDDPIVTEDEAKKGWIQ